MDSYVNFLNSILITDDLLLQHPLYPDPRIGEEDEGSEGKELGRTLVASVLHQPAGDADDVLQHGLGEVLQHHVLLDLQLLVHADGVQDENRGDGFTVAGQQAAELGLQQLFAFLKARFLQGRDDIS